LFEEVDPRRRIVMDVLLMPEVALAGIHWNSFGVASDLPIKEASDDGGSGTSQITECISEESFCENLIGLCHL